MKKYVCTMCGYVSEGSIPDTCPACKAPTSKFAEQKEGLVFADEHRPGVAKDVDAGVLDGLRRSYNSECTDVGMYMAMSRQADRQGYPEIADAFKKIALEKVDHAGRLAETLGEVLDVSTKKNLEDRLTEEHSECQRKKDMAKKSKELGLDAIHDTIHEMCKDDARHGGVFQGLLQRYFR